MRFIILIKKKIIPNQTKKGTESSGTIAIKLSSFTNEFNYDYAGKCCNGEEILQNDEVLCVEGCNTVMKFCLDVIQSTKEFNECPFGSKDLQPFYGKNSTVFGASIMSHENPILIPFNENYQV